MPGVCKLEITETVEELKTLLAQQKTASGFQKVQAIYLLKIAQVKTVKELALTLGVNRITVQRWLKTYREQGISALLKGKHCCGRKPIISPEILADLKQCLSQSDHGFKTYCEIQNWLKQKYDLEVSYKVVYGTIRYQLNLRINPTPEIENH